jgi:sulfoxide reductase heme-binding subunit YedZ
MITDLLLNLPTWPILRILGLTSYTLLFVGIMLGLLYSMPFSKGKIKASLYRWHSFATNAGLVLALGHVLLLMIDIYMPFTWMEIVIPFRAQNKPILTGLGTLSLYGVVIIIITTDFRAFLKPKLWKFIHVMAYPIFLLAMVHGLGTGTDTKNPWIFGLYVSTCLILTLLVLLRSFLSGKSSKVKQKQVNFQ